MNENIRRLVQLQDIAFEIRDLKSRRDRAPDERAELDTAFQRKIEEIGAARLTHEALTEERKQLLEQRQVATARLDKAQGKLMQVSNQREYSAVLNEIDATKTLLEQIDAGIAERTTSIDELSGPAAEADERIAAEKEIIDTAKAKIDDELARGEKRLADLEEKRAELIGLLRPADVRRFDHVFRARGGVAMAAIEGGACGACHVRLRPQVISLARRGEDLVTCDSCRRFLYIREVEESGDDSAAADPPPRDGAAGLGGRQGKAGTAG